MFGDAQAWNLTSVIHAVVGIHVDVGIYLVCYSVLNCLYIEVSQRLPGDSGE